LPENEKQKLKQLFILWLLNSNNCEPIRGKTRFVKLMHIINEILKSKDAELSVYSFYSHHYGPYSDEFVEDVERMIKEGLIGHRIDYIPITDFGGYLENVYWISEEGKKRLAKLSDELNPPNWVLDIVQETKSKYNKIPLSALIREVYLKYPIKRKKEKRKIFKLFSF